DVFAGKKSAQIREILISESAWEEMTCLFAPSLAQRAIDEHAKAQELIHKFKQHEAQKEKVRAETAAKITSGELSTFTFHQPEKMPSSKSWLGRNRRKKPGLE
ncbi:MAG: hypothetical protein E6306_20600, partial [Enterobacter sp.]|nr:hypothetical protein [Enterobacter sp.]